MSLIRVVLFTAGFILAFPSSAWSKRTVRSTPFHSRIEGAKITGLPATKGFLTRIRVQLTNLSDFEQTVTMRFTTTQIYHTITFTDATKAAMRLPAWTMNTYYTETRSRSGVIADVVRTGPVGPKSNGEFYFDITCLAQEGGTAAFPSSCVIDGEPSFAPANHIPDSVAASQDIAGYFELTVNQDRGAILANYHVENLVSYNADKHPAQQITREFNGGRPF